MKIPTRLGLVVATATVLAVLTAGVAAADFSSSRAASQAVAAASIPTPVTPSAAAAGTTVTLSFPAISLSGGRPLTYDVQRLDASTSTPAGVVACAVVAGGCSVSDVPSGTWRFQVRGVYGGWTGTFSGYSNSVTVGSAVPLVIARYTVRQHQSSQQGRATFSGTGSGGATTIVVSIFENLTCSPSVLTSVSFNATGPGSWGPTSETDNLKDNSTYSARATQGGNQSACFTFSVPNY